MRASRPGVDTPGVPEIAQTASSAAVTARASGKRTRWTAWPSAGSMWSMPPTVCAACAPRRRPPRPRCRGTPAAEVHGGWVAGHRARGDLDAGRVPAFVAMRPDLAVSAATRSAAIGSAIGVPTTRPAGLAGTPEPSPPPPTRGTWRPHRPPPPRPRRPRPTQRAAAAGARAAMTVARHRSGRPRGHAALGEPGALAAGAAASGRPPEVARRAVARLRGPSPSPAR